MAKNDRMKSRFIHPMKTMWSEIGLVARYLSISKETNRKTRKSNETVKYIDILERNCYILSPFNTRFAIFFSLKQRYMS